MARPIQYDPEEVLQQAMHIFWEKGYEQTSIQDIVAVTGLKPGSLYNLYGNKEGLFEAVLTLYSEQALEVAKSILVVNDTLIENIEAFLHKVVIAAIADENTDGCLMVKTLLTASHKDEKIQKCITKVFNQVEALLCNVLIEAKKEGETTVDPILFSRLIIITMYGAHVYYKTSKDEKALKESVQILVDTLKK